MVSDKVKSAVKKSRQRDWDHRLRKETTDCNEKVNLCKD